MRCVLPADNIEVAHQRYASRGKLQANPNKLAPTASNSALNLRVAGWMVNYEAYDRQ